MSENIMYKNIADKMKNDKEKINELEIKYDKALTDLVHESHKRMELKADNQELQDSITWWNNRYNALQRDYEDYKTRCEKAVEIYDETINYLTTINGEYMDSNTKKTIQDIVDKMEKELNILNGDKSE